MNSMKICLLILLVMSIEYEVRETSVQAIIACTNNCLAKIVQ